MSFALTACSEVKPDYSQAAGTYYQHDSEGAAISDKWLRLQADGIWTLNGEQNESTGTYRMDGDNISIFLGVVAVMEGVVKGDVLELRYWSLFWQDVVYYKE